MTDLLDSPADPPELDRPATPGVRVSDTARAPDATLVRPLTHRRGSPEPRALGSWRSRTVVLAPHPGDETVTVGRLIARQRTGGGDVIVVAVTDGCGTAPGPDGATGSSRRDQLEALERLGVARGDIHRSILPVGSVAKHVDELVAVLDELVEPDDVLVAPSAIDRDPDHRACHRAARRIAERTGCRLLGSVADTASLTPAIAVADLVLNDEDAERHDRALACHEHLPGCVAPATAGRSRGTSGDDRVERYVTADAPALGIARQTI